MSNTPLILTRRTEAQLSDTARQIVEYAQDISVWLFYGDMGAGKTTLIRAIGQVWKVEDHVSSPTFALVNEYRNAEGQVVYHFDFYRIDDEEEALDIGWEEYLSSGAYCLVEWPAKIRNLLPESYVRLEISVHEDQSRTIYASKYE